MLSNIFSAVLPLRPSRPEPTPPRDISPSSTSSDSDDASDGVPETQPEPFFPALWDVLKVRYLLQWKVPNGLPKELVDLIVDAAEYWPSWEQSMEGERHVQKDQDQVLLKTVPLCYDRQSLERSETPQPLPHRSLHPCRKIVFDLSSHDQGFGRRRENMYECAWTWFDTEVIREAHAKNMYADGTEQEILDNERGQVRKHYTEADSLLLPRGNKLQVNGAHVSEMQHVRIVWHYQDSIDPESPEAHEIERTQGRGPLTLDGRGVRELEVGDSIALWARARFVGWSNHVYRARMRIFWAV